MIKGGKDMSELENILLEYGNRLLDVKNGKENPTLGELVEKPKQAIEAYISKHYIKKEGVLEEYRQLTAIIPYTLVSTGLSPEMLKGWNMAATELEKYANKRIEKLNLGDK